MTGSLISHVGVPPVFARRGLRGILGCLSVGGGGRLGGGGGRCSDGAFGLLLAAGLRAGLRGRSLLSRLLDGQFLLLLVALQEAKLDSQLQNGFLLFVDGLVQVGVFVLQGDIVQTTLQRTAYGSTTYAEIHTTLKNEVPFYKGGRKKSYLAI